MSRETGREKSVKLMLGVTEVILDLVGTDFFPNFMIELTWPSPVQEKRARQDVHALVSATDRQIQDCMGMRTGQRASPLFLVVWDGDISWKNCKLFVQFDQGEFAKAALVKAVPLLWAGIIETFDELNVSLALGLQDATFEFMKYLKAKLDRKSRTHFAFGFWSPEFDNNSAIFKQLGGEDHVIRVVSNDIAAVPKV